MNGLLKVDAQELVTIANRMQDQISNMNSAYIKIDQIVNRSQRYWQGEASDNHIRKNDDIKADYTKVYTELAKEPSNLYKIAGVYKEAEETTTDISMSLPVDVII